MKSIPCGNKLREVEELADLAALARPANRSISDSLKIKNEKAEAWLTTQQAADYLGISVGSLRNRVAGGEIPRRKLGRLNRYLRSELDALLSAKAFRE